LDHSLQSLRRIARFTDRIWPLPAAARPRSANAAAIRGLGAPQEDAQRGTLIGGWTIYATVRAAAIILSSALNDVTSAIPAQSCSSHR